MWNGKSPGDRETQETQGPQETGGIPIRTAGRQGCLPHVPYYYTTLGYHISPTLSRNCLVYRFLLRVRILYWCLRVILYAPGMVCRYDPGPGWSAWTWAVCIDPGPLGHMMDSPCAWAIWNDPGLFEKYIKYKNVTKLVWTQDLTILILNHMTQYSNKHLFVTLTWENREKAQLSIPYTPCTGLLVNSGSKNQK